MYNQIRKVYRTRVPMCPQYNKIKKEIVSYFLRVGMLFLFMIVYVRQSRKNDKQ